MLNIFVQSREVAARLDSLRLHSTPRVVPTISDEPQGDKLPAMPLAFANPAREPSRRTSAGAPLSLGSLLYLGSIGLIAAGIVAVFFGAGFALLVNTGRDDFRIGQHYWPGGRVAPASPRQRSAANILWSGVGA